MNIQEYIDSHGIIVIDTQEELEMLTQEDKIE